MSEKKRYKIDKKQIKEVSDAIDSHAMEIATSANEASEKHNKDYMGAAKSLLNSELYDAYLLGASVCLAYFETYNETGDMPDCGQVSAFVASKIAEIRLMSTVSELSERVSDVASDAADAVRESLLAVSRFTADED